MQERAGRPFPTILRSNGHSSPQMMMDKPKQGKTFCATILG